MTSAELSLEAKKIRKIILQMISKSKSSHLGTCFSIVDILTVLYKNILSIPSVKDPSRDIFLLSKGHGAVALYATLGACGFFDMELLETYAQDGSKLAALANINNERRFYTILGDGECNEGSVWEAANFANQFKLKNLTAIIDCNKWQCIGRSAEVMNMDNMAERWRACGWETIELDGHNYDELQKVLAYSHGPRESTKPLAIVAHTIKGKGVSWMEDKLEWHYKFPDPEQLQQAIAEIDSK